MNLTNHEIFLSSFVILPSTNLVLNSLWLTLPSSARNSGKSMVPSEPWVRFCNETGFSKCFPSFWSTTEKGKLNTFCIFMCAFCYQNAVFYSLIMRKIEILPKIFRRLILFANFLAKQFFDERFQLTFDSYSFLLISATLLYKKNQFKGVPVIKIFCTSLPITF